MLILSNSWFIIASYLSFRFVLRQWDNMKIFSASPTFQANTIRLLVFACIVTLNYATSGNWKAFNKYAHLIYHHFWITDKSGEFVADRFNKESIDKPKNNLLLDSNLRNHDTKTYTALPKNDMLVEPKPLSENSNQEFLDYLIMWLSAIIACVSGIKLLINDFSYSVSYHFLHIRSCKNSYLFNIWRVSRFHLCKFVWSWHLLAFLGVDLLWQQDSRCLSSISNISQKAQVL